jgi:hypothetical protein
MHIQYIICVNFRAMIDKLCFMAVYGSKTTLEAKVPLADRASFHQIIMDRHKEDGARDQFSTALQWKTYIRANPQALVVDVAPDAFFALMVGAVGDNEGGPAGGGPARGAEAAMPETP